MDKKRIMVAMSGGVDSSVAAALLQQQGHEVQGLTMRVWDGPVDVAVDARRVAEQLGIPFHLVDLREEFQQRVVKPFCSEYLRGRTPNPCVLCNQAFKFRLLLDQAQALGAEYLATGHYVRVVQRDGRYLLAKGHSAHKDQSYFLFTLTQEQLSRVCFPLGEMDKDQVRAQALKMQLAVATKGDSQDICFIPDGDYIGFLEEQCPVADRSGEIVHVGGQVLGRHAGTHRYTVGQRRGLGLAWSEPLFVVRIDAAQRQVVVGERHHLDVGELLVNDCNWIIAEPSEPLRCRVRIRYRHREAPATVTVLGEGRCRVVFDAPEKGVTPGQAAVFYDDDLVLGGGWIA
ncbi:MAG: tRNA 2-thiouridine(34) synthase MnmA [Desulfuromonadales bacterium C00003094]|jgi:tRNA-specific 2-thiouridylase|nr:MAG: tRNA 2-thiouridine(34) synthase MnmA [Desulfuromonadales bacterium C00003094]OEU74861.1 MAG: tRNA 2-thiouridine(34) synthase MnmA [Desulfuromonadales bacterium C00003107]